MAAHIKRNQVPTSNGITCPHGPEYAIRQQATLLLFANGSIFGLPSFTDAQDVDLLAKRT